jgi:hypothetical protein
VTTPRPLTGRERERRATILRGIAVALWVVFGICFATVIFVATTGTELVAPNGATLDCGSILVPSDSPFAAANCGGVNDDSMTQVLVASIIGVVALVVGIVLFVRSRRGIHW